MRAELNQTLHILKGLDAAAKKLPAGPVPVTSGCKCEAEGDFTYHVAASLSVTDYAAFRASR